MCLESDRPIVAYDRLGFGQSDPSPGKLSLDFIQREAASGFAAVRQNFNFERFILLGHSVGGGMAVNCTATFSDTCTALTTESTQAFVEDRTIRGIEQAKALFEDPIQAARLKKYRGDKAAWVLDAWVNTWLDPAFADWSLKRALPNVKCPVLAIHGMEDEYGSRRHPELIGSLVDGPAQVELLVDTRHVPHREKESVVISIVCRFLGTLE